MGLTQITTGGVDDNINIDSNTLKVDGTNNRVGIGTATPVAALDVNGRIASVAGSTGTPSFHCRTDTNTGINLPESDRIQFITAGSERLRIDSSGRVGIGTTSATQRLTVGAGSGPEAILVRTGSSNTGELRFSDTGDDNYQGALVYNHSTNAMQFLANGVTERMRIDSSGNVGIGTTSPSYALHAVGTIAARDSGSSTDIRLIPGNQQGSYSINANSAQHIFVSGANERMRIDSSGRLLINTTNGVELIHGVGGGLKLTRNKTGNPSSGQSLMSVGFHGVNDTNSNAAAEAKIEAFAAENHSGTTAASNLRFYTKPSGTGPGSSPTERMRIDSSGRLLVGKTSHSGDALFVVESNHTSGGIIGEFDNNDSGNFGGVRILGGVNDRECRLQSLYGSSFFTFYTENTGAATERVRITKEGYLKAADNATYYDAIASHHEFNQSGTDINMLFRTTAPNTAATQVYIGVDRAATSAYWFFQGVSSFSGSADTEFYIRGDGNAFIDGSWSGGGADYAEYFEWSDGNTEAEDRRGISVVLDGDKIREAVAGEEPIGVVSGNPSVVGDADVDRWKGKYLRDDFGTYLLDTHNVVEWDETITDDEGKESIKKHSYEDWNVPAGIVVPTDAVVSATDENGQPYTHRRLNPDYNPDTAYVSRENRAEWDTVGLMGKLRIRKGQVTGTRWIKMRDVSDTVEEWLVR